jgi:hypothetical protein
MATNEQIAAAADTPGPTIYRTLDSKARILHATAWAAVSPGRSGHRRDVAGITANRESALRRPSRISPGQLAQD